MKTPVLLLAAVMLGSSVSAGLAGGAVGVRWGGGGGGGAAVRWGGGGGGAVGVRWGGGRYWGGRPYCGNYYSPRAVGWGWGSGWGWGWRRPVVRVVTPAPLVATTWVAPARVVAGPVLAGSVLAASQQRLAELGYYNGRIDGAFGPRTSAAITNFQQDYGLPVTGRLDRNTRASLGL